LAISIYLFAKSDQVRENSQSNPLGIRTKKSLWTDPRHSIYLKHSARCVSIKTHREESHYVMAWGGTLHRRSRFS
jgi:hypothetical protein